jgi:hypothetical protein
VLLLLKCFYHSIALQSRFFLFHHWSCLSGVITYLEDMKEKRFMVTALNSEMGGGDKYRQKNI